MARSSGQSGTPAAVVIGAAPGPGDRGTRPDPGAAAANGAGPSVVPGRNAGEAGAGIGPATARDVAAIAACLGLRNLRYRDFRHGLEAHWARPSETLPAEAANLAAEPAPALPGTAPFPDVPLDTAEAEAAVGAPPPGRVLLRAVAGDAGVPAAGRREAAAASAHARHGPRFRLLEGVAAPARRPAPMAAGARTFRLLAALPDHRSNGAD